MNSMKEILSDCFFWDITVFGYMVWNFRKNMNGRKNGNIGYIIDRSFHPKNKHCT